MTISGDCCSASGWISQIALTRDWIGSLVIRARSSLVESVDQTTVIDESRIMTIGEGQRGFPVSVLAEGADTDQQIRDARPVINIVTLDQLAFRTSD